MAETAAPSISIVMNCYNSQKYLKEAIDSVLAQTVSDWEIIFWDNQSTDQSKDIVLSYSDPRIRYFLAPKHTSLGEARNLAVEKTSADWFCFLDCDDLWLPKKLEEQKKIILEHHENLGLIYTRAQILGGKYSGLEYAPHYKDKKLPEGNILREYLLRDNFIPIVSAVINKKAFISVGGIPSDYRQSEDFYIFAAIASQYHVKAVPSVTCVYRLHDSNTSLSQAFLACVESIRVIEKFWEFTPEPFKDEFLKNRIVSRLKTLEGLHRVKSKKNTLLGLFIVMSHPLLSIELVYRYLVKKDRNLSVSEAI